jgi:hypothetical protein
MRRSTIFPGLLALVALSPPLRAEEAPIPPQGGVEEGMNLVERGMRSILEGIFTEMQPAIEDMSRALGDVRPMAEQLLRMIDDIGNYEAPVVLDNGDILIRRKPAAPTPPPAEPLRDGEIEL